MPGAPAQPSPALMALQPKHVAVTGSVNADLVFTLQRVPRAGETLPARSLAVHPGGKVRCPMLRCGSDLRRGSRLIIQID